MIAGSELLASRLRGDGRPRRRRRERLIRAVAAQRPGGAGEDVQAVAAGQDQRPAAGRHASRCGAEHVGGARAGRIKPRPPETVTSRRSESIPSDSHPSAALDVGAQRRGEPGGQPALVAGQDDAPVTGQRRSHALGQGEIAGQVEAEARFLQVGQQRRLVGQPGRQPVGEGSVELDRTTGRKRARKPVCRCRRPGCSPARSAPAARPAPAPGAIRRHGRAAERRCGARRSAAPARTGPGRRDGSGTPSSKERRRARGQHLLRARAPQRPVVGVPERVDVHGGASSRR